MTPTDARKLSGSAQETLRKDVIQAVTFDGVPQAQASKTFGVSRVAVCLWVKAYREGGEGALRSRRKGRPLGGKLSEEQAVGIQKSLLCRCPDQLRLPGLLWTRDLVSELIRRRHKIILSRWTISRYLKEWSLSASRPRFGAREHEPAQVRHWRQVTYPAICRQARKENARIWWGGITRRCSEGARTSGPEGSGRKADRNIISAITTQGDMRFMGFGNWFTPEVFLKFLDRLIRQKGDEAVFLIVDRHDVHTAAKTRRWLDGHADTIRLFFSPFPETKRVPGEPFAPWRANGVWDVWPQNAQNNDSRARA